MESQIKQQGCKYFACRSPPPPRPWGDEVKRSKFNLFQNMVMLHIKLNGITNAVCFMVANILPVGSPPPPPPPLLLGVGSKGQNSTFSEHSHVAFRVKWNRKCSNMQAHILSLHTPSAPGVGSKVKIIIFL